MLQIVYPLVHAKMQFWSILVFVDAWETLAQHRRYHLVVSISVLSVVQSRKHKVQRPRRCIKHHLWRLGPLRLWQSDIMRPAQKYASNCLSTSTCKDAILVNRGQTLAQHRRYHLVVSISVLSVVQRRKYKVQRPRRCIKHHLWRLGPLRLWQSDILRPAQKYASNCLTTSTCKDAILVNLGLC